MSSNAFVWAKGVTAGSATRKTLLLLLADYADEAGSCFPGQERLARETELGVRTVRRALAELESAGLICRERRTRDDGTRTSDRIRLTMQPAAQAGGRDGGLPANDDRSTGHSRPDLPARVAGHEPLGEPQDEPPVTPLPPAQQPSLLPVEPTPAPRNTSSAVVSSRRARWDLYFDAFWDVYPRKAGKRDAQKAWEQARRTGVDPAVIVDGARRYAADPNREDAYTAHPATWLRRGSWDDDPLPSRTAARPGRADGMLAGLAAIAANGNGRPPAIGGGR